MADAAISWPPLLGRLGRLVVKPADVCRVGIVSCRGRLGSVTFCILTYFWKKTRTRRIGEELASAGDMRSRVP